MDTIFVCGASPLSHIPREVAALMAALQHKLQGTGQLQELEDEEWKRLLTFADLAHLTLSLAHLEWTGFPLWVMERLESNLDDNTARFERVKATYKEASAAFDNAGVEHIVLKGFTQFPGYVCHPQLRVQSDLDIYVPPAMIGRAQEAVESLGYGMEESLDYSRADHLPTFLRLGDWQWRGNQFDPDMPLSIELHFALWNESVARFSIAEVDLFWERRIRRTVEDMDFWSLDPVDHLGYLALHILRNIFSGDWVLNHVYELSVFLNSRAQDDEFWKRWHEAHSPQLRVFEMVAIWHAKAWFDCDLHSNLEGDLAALPMPIAKWLGRFTRSSLSGMFVQNKDFIWLHAAFLNSLKEKRRFILRSLIPKRIPNRNDPVVRLKNRQARASRWANPRIRYLSYILTRLSAHVRIVTQTLASGIAWWHSQHQLKG